MQPHLAFDHLAALGVRPARVRAGEGHRLQAAQHRIEALTALRTETVMTWEMEAMSTGAESSALTVRDVVQRQGGECWFERDRVRHEAFFRSLLPLAPSAAAQGQQDAAVVRSNRWPKYYDFDLFADTDTSRALDGRRLGEVVYTVFDTETTGLDPAGGEEIIQGGAARIVNGRLLRCQGFSSSW